MIFSDIFWKYNCKVAIEYDGLQISYDELCDKVNYFSKLCKGKFLLNILLYF